MHQEEFPSIYSQEDAGAMRSLSPSDLTNIIFTFSTLRRIRTPTNAIQEVRRQGGAQLTGLGLA